MLKEQYHKIEKIFPQIGILKNLYEKLPGRGMSGRYIYLLEAVKEAKARKIMEVGTYTGRHAEKMIKQAQKFHDRKEVEYYGFDLFEMMDEDTFKNEVSLHPISLEAVRNKLEKTGANIHLYKGYTKDTLLQAISDLPQMDFIYIDGGHSLETINLDWNYAQMVMGAKTIVIFDDYWDDDNSGCKRLIGEIDRSKFNVEILPIQDKFKKDWGTLKINFVKVFRKK